MAHSVLRLITDRLEPRTALDGPLPAANRVLYVAQGMATVTTGGAAATLAANSGWFHTGEIDVVKRDRLLSVVVRHPNPTKAVTPKRNSIS